MKTQASSRSSRHARDRAHDAPSCVSTNQRERRRHKEPVEIMRGLLAKTVDLRDTGNPQRPVAQREINHVDITDPAVPES